MSYSAVRPDAGSLEVLWPVPGPEFQKRFLYFLVDIPSEYGRVAT